MFSPGLYNQQRSSYVGSPLGEYMNLLPYAQQRYDVARETLDDTDVFINAIEHNDSDRDALYSITSPFRDRIAEARDSGDFRSMYDDIKGLSKQVGGNKGIKTIQESYLGAMKQKELESQYGSQALSFSDPSKHQSIKVDENGNVKYDVYTPHVEKRGDYDKRIQDIWSILKADGMPIDLKQHTGAIDGFLKYGSWKGIGDAKINGYLQSAFDRYVESPEGEQDYRRLTQIEGMAPEEAALDIQRRMLAVGSGMKYSDVDMRYLQDPSAEAKAAAASTMMGSGDTGYVPASSATTTTMGAILGGNKIEVDSNGKLVNSFDFGKNWNQAFAQSADQRIQNPLTGWLQSFVTTTLGTVYDGVFGENTEMKLNPNQQVAFNNLQQMAADQYTGGDVSKLSKQDVAEYFNSHMNDEITYQAPAETLSKKGFDYYNDIYTSEPVETDSGIVGVMPKGMSSNRFFYKGEPVTYNRLFGKDGEFGIPAATSITHRFGANNPYGFPNGGLVVQVMTADGETIDVPMETTVGASAVDVMNNALYQPAYNKFTQSSITPIELPGVGKVSVSRDPTRGTYSVYSDADPNTPIASVSANEDFQSLLGAYPAFQKMPIDEMLATGRVTMEEIMSRALIQKIYNANQ